MVRIEDAFKQVRVAVRKDSNGLQTPWESTSLESELVLKRTVPNVAPAPAKPTVASLSRGKSSLPGAAPRFEIDDAWEWRITDQITGEARTRKRNIRETQDLISSG